MNKRCARCDKTVYPIEELNCLDKLWHKQCFKCQSCGMTLNMRNYKGYNKDPYCEAHVPKAKATSVAETPEMKRLAENTKIQSNAKYHADFEKNKGKLTQVADDPETLRLKQNSQIISNVAYHGDLKKKAEMEWKRTLTSENGQSEEVTNHSNVPHYEQVPVAVAVAPESYHVKNVESRSAPKNSPYSARQSSTLIYSSNKGPLNPTNARSVGSIADIDPVNNFYGSLTGPQQQYQQYQQQQYHHQQQQQQQQQHQYHHHQQQQLHQHHQQQQQQLQQQQHLQQQQLLRQQEQHLHQQQQQQQHQHHMQPMHYNGTQRIQPPKQEMNKSGNIYRAMYDYDARESDEVSFLDGDIILNCVHIHDGWMSGVVQRSGQCGLLPANYVEPIII